MQSRALFFVILICFLDVALLYSEGIICGKRVTKPVQPKVAFSAASSIDSLVIKSIDPLVKYVPGQRPGDLQETDEYDVCRGEAVRIQVVVWNPRPINGLTLQCTASTSGISVGAVRQVGFVSINVKGSNIANRLQSANGYYPDPLMERNWPINISGNGESAFWIVLNISESVQPGTYYAKITGQDGSGNAVGAPINIKINVSSPVVSKSEYPWFSNFLFVDVPSLGPATMKLSYLNDNKPVNPFSSDYWTKLNEIAAFMGQTGQNTVLISPQRLAQYSFSGDKMLIDFSRFDSTVNCFIRNGVIGRIEGWQLCSRVGNWESSYVIYYVKKAPSGIPVFAYGQPTDPGVLSYYKSYLDALVGHLKAMGWYDKFYQHIADEPIDANAESYLAIAKMIKSIAPDLKTLEAIQTTKVADAITVPVPELDVLSNNRAYFENLVAKGKEVWLYTAFLPQGTFANRFIEQQALQHRLLFWIAAKYGLKGVLNWGYNSWYNSDPFSNLGKTSGPFTIPAGDDYIVYPKKDGLLGSIRLETMEDGLADYALLEMLRQKNPGEAERLMSEVVVDFNKYITDVSAFRQIRRELLNDLK